MGSLKRLMLAVLTHILRWIMVELLSPAGSEEGMRAVIAAGADAVYMGGQRFGARAYAQNPDQSSLLYDIDYCHIHGRKLYLTVNTLLREDELKKELYDFILPCYERGLDAVLVQDPGVFCFIREHFPSLPIHASTQMSVQSSDGAKLLSQMGASRIVPARELTLDEIRDIHASSDIEIECFVHGALCYSYSGRCLMSSMIGGRSGNRGRCAQPCRLPYLLRENGSSGCLLSLKDINTLRILPQLIEAGICSFKIEGRMKRPEYAAGVTSVYRKYIDMYLSSGKDASRYRVDPEDEQLLLELFNRGGFSEGYYDPSGQGEMLSGIRPDHAGTTAACVTGTDRGAILLRAAEDLYTGDALLLEGAGEHVMKEDVRRNEVFSVRTKARLKKGQAIPRVRCEKLLSEIRERFIETEVKEKIKGNFEIRSGQPAILTVLCKASSVCVRGETAQAALSRAVSEEELRRQLMKTGGTPFQFEDLKVSCEDGLFISMKSINELRRKALSLLQEEILSEFLRIPEEKEQTGNPGSGATEMTTEKDEESVPVLTAFCSEESQIIGLLSSSVSDIYADSLIWMDARSTVPFREMARRIRESGKRCILALPPVWRNKVKKDFFSLFSEEDLDSAQGFLLRCTDQLYAFAAEKGHSDEHEYHPEGKILIADANLYAWNREAAAFFKAHGIRLITVPLELNEAQIRALSDGEGRIPWDEMVVYGRAPLMISAQCLLRNTTGCTHHSGVMHLQDRTGAILPVRNHCGICTNVISNCFPTDLGPAADKVRRIPLRRLCLYFTDEEAQECGRIAREAGLMFTGGAEAASLAANSTRGHFKRGVE